MEKSKKIFRVHRGDFIDIYEEVKKLKDEILKERPTYTFLAETVRALLNKDRAEKDRVTVPLSTIKICLDKAGIRYVPRKKTKSGRTAPEIINKTYKERAIVAQLHQVCKELGLQKLASFQNVYNMVSSQRPAGSKMYRLISPNDGEAVQIAAADLAEAYRVRDEMYQGYDVQAVTPENT